VDMEGNIPDFVRGVYRGTFIQHSAGVWSAE
jgi:hypothetical protein